MPHTQVDLQGRIQDVQSRIQQIRPNVMGQLQNLRPGDALSGRGGQLVSRAQSRVQQLRPGGGVLKQAMQGNLLDSVKTDQEIKQSGFRSMDDEPSSGSTDTGSGFRSIT